MRSSVQNLFVVLALIASVNHSTAGNVLLTWVPNPDANVVGYKIYYGTASQVYTTNFAAGNVTNTTISGLASGTYYFAATSYDAAGDESGYSTETSCAVTNQPPTLDPIASLSVTENAGAQIVTLAGISSGATNQTLPLMVTAVSSNPTLIPTPVVSYISPNTTGTLTFAPGSNVVGTATITVSVNNSDPGNNIVSQSFTVTVSAINQPPTLNPIPNMTINENTNRQTVQLTGITSGNPGQNQTLTVTAASSNTGLVQPSVSYISPNTNGTLTFKPAHNRYGVATITVTVKNNGNSNNIMTRSFAVTVLSPAQAAALAKLSVSGNVAAALTQVSYTNGQFSFTVSGADGSVYVVQASTDLVNWTTLQTNTAPFTVVDTNAATFTQRFYRAGSAQ